MAVDPNEKEDVGAGAPADGPKLNDMIVIFDPLDGTPILVLLQVSKESFKYSERRQRCRETEEELL